MKRIPGMERLEEILRSSRLVADGFMGEDPRILEEILEDDASDVAGLGTSADELADRMKELTHLARQGLGTTVKLDNRLEGFVQETRGAMVCPWPHSGSYSKNVTTVRRTDTDETIRWSDLSIHFIRAHGFFEGRGSHFRLEPKDLMRILF